MQLMWALTLFPVLQHEKVVYPWHFTFHSLPILWCLLVKLLKDEKSSPTILSYNNKYLYSTSYLVSRESPNFTVKKSTKKFNPIMENCSRCSMLIFYSICRIKPDWRLQHGWCYKFPVCWSRRAVNEWALICLFCQATPRPQDSACR